MTLNRKKQQISGARQLRRNMTDGEKRLWSELREFRKHYSVHFRRQVPIGPLIVDFAAVKHKLIIELDGEHHHTPDGMANDARRDAWFAENNYRILRINTGEFAANPDGCIETVLHELGLMRP